MFKSEFPNRIINMCNKFWKMSFVIDSSSAIRIGKYTQVTKSPCELVTTENISREISFRFTHSKYVKLLFIKHFWHLAMQYIKFSIISTVSTSIYDIPIGWLQK